MPTDPVTFESMQLREEPRRLREYTRQVRQASEEARSQLIGSRTKLHALPICDGTCGISACKPPDD